MLAKYQNFKTLTRGPEATQKIGFKLAREIKTPLVVALIGDLGGGKTTFAQGFAAGLGLKEKIKSPSFLVYREYKIPAKKKLEAFYHFDLYRLKGAEQILDLGFSEILEGKNLVLVEWADRILELLPSGALIIEFIFKSPKERSLSFKFL